MNIKGKPAKWLRSILILALLTGLTAGTASAEFFLKGMAGMAISGTRGYLEEMQSPVIGAGLEFWAGRHVGVEVEAQYLKRGHKATAVQYDDSDGSFHVLFLPLLARVRFPLGDRSPLTLGLSAGTGYSIILSDMDSNFPSQDLNYILGGNLDMAVGRTILFVDVKYDWGSKFLSIQYLPMRVEFRTNTLTVAAGVKARL